MDGLTNRNILESVGAEGETPVRASAGLSYPAPE